ncbi:MAG: hypothetical protein L3J93_00235 [Thermoplasmata archaeon]|nr:hypothetical protein [Thermoplasmata archaeon]
MPQIKEGELAQAIERTLVRRGKLPPEEVPKVARMVLGYFGLHDSVLDNKLSSDDRDTFYRLEEEGLLSSEEEDATVSRGKTWRIHYWFLKKDRIRDVGQRSEIVAAPGAAEVYKGMADSDWKRNGANRPQSPPQ